ncbi:MAG: IS5 family transposase [Chitinophagales bacterium]
MQRPSKNRAPAPKYVSEKQLKFPGFESPFERKLNPNNRWVVLSNLLPWDELCSIYWKYLPEKETGRPSLNPRIVLGSLIIKHLCDLDDRETVDQISENIYMQYFLGYSSFNDEPPFNASLFVEFRKRLGLEEMEKINERVSRIKQELLEKQNKNSIKEKGEAEPPLDTTPTHKGQLITDATVCPQDIAYPTDIDLLNDAREKSEELIDLLYPQSELQKKPRTYREKARKEYLKIAQKKTKSKKDIRTGLKQQLGYVGRNIRSIHRILGTLPTIPLKAKEYKYLLVIQHLYEQQRTMYTTKTHSIEDRIVSIHQPHVRPIVRGKSKAKVEFGAKINVSLVDGITFIDDFSWDAYNEGTRLQKSVGKYKQRMGYYPEEVLADKICCTRENRAFLKEKGILLKAKPLGRPKKQALSNQVSPGERNPIEGKFGQAKTGYGLDRIKARLSQTSESWIASIILVLNLVHLAEVALLWIKVKIEILKLIAQKNTQTKFWSYAINKHKIMAA